MVTDVLCFRSLRRSLITLESTGCWVRTGESSPEHTLCTSMFCTVLTNIFLSFSEWWCWKANRRKTPQLKVICTSSRATRTATDNTHYIIHVPETYTPHFHLWSYWTKHYRKENTQRPLKLNTTDFNTTFFWFGMIPAPGTSYRYKIDTLLQADIGRPFNMRDRFV